MQYIFFPVVRFPGIVTQLSYRFCNLNFIFTGFYVDTMNLSLCGCGFLGIYHLGVAACLKQYAPSFLSTLQKIGGASAGALVAGVLVIADNKIEVWHCAVIYIKLHIFIHHISNRKPIKMLDT